MGETYKNYGGVVKTETAKDVNMTTNITNIRLEGNISSISSLLGLPTGTVNTGSVQKSFRSYHNTYLRANPDGKVDLALHCDHHEKWYIMLLEHNRCLLRSVHGTFLRGTPYGSVDAVENCGGWEEWTLIPSNGKIGLRSYHGTFIRAKDDKTVDLVKECYGWELWTVDLTTTKNVLSNCE